MLDLLCSPAVQVADAVFLGCAFMYWYYCQVSQLERDEREYDNDKKFKGMVK